MTCEPSALSTRLRPITMAGTLLVALPWVAAAQFTGTNLLGDFGLRSGTLAPPGSRVGVEVPWRHVNSTKGPDGQTTLGLGTIDVGGVTPTVEVVFDRVFLGADLGVRAAVPVQSSAIETPVIPGHADGVGVGDLYVQPLVLGWHGRRADAVVGYGFTAPTGRYAPGSDDNVGLGMWSQEFSAGTTVYLDDGRLWHAAATAFYEVHSKKRDTDLTVGSYLTIEGGVGVTLPDGPTIGLASFAQWQATEDSGTAVPAALRGHKGRLFGLGPEIDLLKGALVLRYLFEFGGRTVVQGGTFIASCTVGL